ncbi:hypothetical protein HAX54_012577, partial [Datura stramonium]|nr:hypothetical protein [Datura stramonium]
MLSSFLDEFVLGFNFLFLVEVGNPFFSRFGSLVASHLPLSRPPCRVPSCGNWSPNDSLCI